MKSSCPGEECVFYTVSLSHCLSFPFPSTITFGKEAEGFISSVCFESVKNMMMMMMMMKHILAEDEEEEEGSILNAKFIDLAFLLLLVFRALSLFLRSSLLLILLLLLLFLFFAYFH